MSITYPTTLPVAPTFKNLQMTAVSTVAMSRSPYSGSQQVYVHPGEWWEAAAALPPMTRDNAERWIAFFLGLNGQEGTFWLGDPTGINPRGVGGGSPRVNGAGQAGRKELQTTGWPANTIGVLLRGDYIQIGISLFKVITSVNTDGGGNATIQIWPRIRISPANGDPIIYTNAQGVFRLASSRNGWSYIEGPIGQLSFNAVEAF